MSRIRWYGPSLVLLLTVVVVLVVGPTMVRQIAWAQTDAKVSLIRQNLSENPSLAELSDAFRKVATVVEPSVVHVQVLSRSQRRGPGNLPEDMLRRFFGPQWQDRMPDRNQPEPEGGENFEQYDPARPSGNGSGWVYDNQGHIVTNNHVVENADAIKVRFSSGAEYTAEIVGTDPSTDVAVLKIEASNLHPAVVAGDAIAAGDIVFAFGSPFGFDFSMSQGIVSAKGRKLHILTGGYENFIQTDAAINPGNSGGPLTNIYGEVVGMNSAIASRTGVYNGLGFAIPVQMVTRVVDQIVESGRVSRGYLGIYIDTLEPKMAETFGYDGEGVLVVGATEDNSPAVDAGIESGDIIMRVDGEPVTTADELRFRVAGLQPGSEVEIELFRNGETMTRTVTLGELPNEAMAAVSPPDEAAPDAGNAQGMDALRKFGIADVETFTEAMADRLNVPFQSGVIITGVRRGSLAATQGLRDGILIADVQGEPVASVEELLNEIAQRDPTQGIRLKVMAWNPGTKSFAPRFVLLELPGE